MRYEQTRSRLAKKSPKMGKIIDARFYFTGEIKTISRSDQKTITMNANNLIGAIGALAAGFMQIKNQKSIPDLH